MRIIADARSHLEGVRDIITPEAYDALSRALDVSADLRTAPGREATAAERARGGAPLRTQPHLAAGDAPARGPAEQKRAPAGATPQPERKRDASRRGMTLSH
jgi:hypothetical protein